MLLEELPSDSLLVWSRDMHIKESLLAMNVEERAVKKKSNQSSENQEKIE